MATLQQKKQAIINAANRELTNKLNSTPANVIDQLYSKVINKKPLL
jgi:hypothetical protein